MGGTATKRSAAAPRNNGDTPRTPPADQYAEESLLGAMLLTYDAVVAGAERCSPDDFYRPAHGHIFEAILALYEDGDPIDSATVAGVLHRAGRIDDIGGPAKLIELLSHVPASSSAPKYADTVASLAAQRRMLSAVLDAEAAIYNGDTAAATNHIDRALDAAGSAAGDGRAFHPLDLTALLTGNPTPPSMLTGWLYAGGLHIMQSEPGVGKSWLALWQALGVMREGGTVIYLDEEGGPELVAERLRAMGADPDLIRSRFRYFAFEGRAWDAADAAALEALLRTLERDGHDPRLAVLDSLPDFLASAGVDENSAGEVTAFVARIATPLRKFGTAILALDHLAKPTGGGRGARSRSRYSRGSGAKLAKANATIHVEQQTEFNRTTNGLLKVWQSKDRQGAIDLPPLAGKPRLVTVTVGDGRVLFAEKEDDGSAPAGEHGGMPTSVMELVSAWCSREAAAGPRSQKDLLEAVSGFRTTTKRAAIDLLVEHGFITITRGRSNAKLYQHARLYRQDEELPPKIVDANGVTLEMF